MCGDCANRPELEVCPQCRMPLDGQISRNRALEELARRTFPKEEEESRKRRGESGSVPNNHQRTHSGRSRPRPFSRPNSSRFGNVQSQGSANVNNNRNVNLANIASIAARLVYPDIPRGANVVDVDSDDVISFLNN